MENQLNEESQNQSKKTGLTKFDWIEWTMVGYGLLFPVYHPILFIVAMTLPVFAIFYFGSSGRKNFVSIYYLPLKGIEVTSNRLVNSLSWLILFKLFFHFKFESAVNFLMPAVVCLIISYIVADMVLNKYIGQLSKARDKVLFLTAFNLFVFSFTSAIGINCLFDESKPIVYNSEVLERNYIRGVGNSRSRFELTIRDWRHDNKTREFTVRREEYHKFPQGKSVNVLVKDGLFGIKWLELE